MSLVLIAIGLEVYQVIAHAHCFLGRTLPASHRSAGGFGGAIAGDALSYLLSCCCLYAAGAAWAWLLLPLLAHVFYGCLLAFVRPLYLRIHDYRMRSIYADGSFRRAKRAASLLDASFHVLAVVLLARQAPALGALSLAGIGVAAYCVVFTPGRSEALAGHLRPAEAPPPSVQDQHA